MMRGPTLAALVTAVALLALPAPAGAALRWGKCEGEGHRCARLYRVLLELLGLESASAGRDRPGP